MSGDPIWQEIREEVAGEAEHEPMLASFLYATVLNHDRLEDALSFRLAEKLQSANLGAMQLREIVWDAMEKDPSIGEAMRADLRAAYDRDPACRGLCVPLLYYKGFHALEAYRIAHLLWQEGRHALARHLQNRISEVFGVDIHPGARMGKGIFIDHATGVVIGETAVVEDDVSMLHGVTLGGTGKHGGDRHPKIGRGVLISACASIFGNIRIGEGAKIGGGSVVLRDVAPHTTVVGVPSRPVGRPETDSPALEMDQSLPGTDGDGI